jgi:hypothetical protein
MQDEMRHGLSYFQQTIMDMVPIFYRRVDTALANIGLPRMPLNHRLFEFGSWMGGDRDGNPNVLAGTTRDVVVLARCGGGTSSSLSSAVKTCCLCVRVCCTLMSFYEGCGWRQQGRQPICAVRDHTKRCACNVLWL